jgi:hypothetical protein
LAGPCSVPSVVSVIVLASSPVSCLLLCCLPLSSSVP